MNSGLWWLVQNLVSVSVLIVFVSVACLALRHRPAWRHALWLVVLIKFVTPPVVSWPWSVSEIAEQFRPAEAPTEVAKSLPEPEPPLFIEQPLEPAVFSESPIVADEADSNGLPAESALIFADPAVSSVAVEPAPVEPLEFFTESTLQLVQLLLLGLWIGGGAIALTIQVLRLRRQNRVVSQGVAGSEALAEEIERISSELNVRPIPARVVSAIAAPFLWCVGRLRLIWPDALTGEKALRRSRGIIAHELAHVRRRDHWVAWLELAAGVIWWWNPLFWFVRRRLRESAEMACDALALSIVDDRREYAEMFLELSSSVKTGAPAPVLGVSTGTPSSFERRLTMILSDRVSSKVSVWGILLVGCLAAIALPNLMFAQATSERAAPTKETEAEKSTGIPLLEKIPLIGKQFSNQLVEETKGDALELEYRPVITETGAYGLVVQPRAASSIDPASPPASSSESETAVTLVPSETALAGDWAFIESHINNAVQGPNFEEYLWSFDTKKQKVKTTWKIGAQADWKVGEQTGQGENRFTVDTAQSPPHLTIYGDNMLILAIYELNGDRLKISYFGKSQAARPKSFEDKRRDAGGLYTFFLKRVEPKADANSSLDVDDPFRVEVVPGSAPNRRSGKTAETQMIESYRGGSSSISRSSAGPLPSLEVSAVEEERRLQARLLELDVEAAAAAYESAKEKMDSLDALSERGGGVVSKRTVDEARADARQKQIQLERAKTMLSLFELQAKRQAKRERDKAAEVERVRQIMMERSRQNRPVFPDEGAEEPSSPTPVNPLEY